MPKTQNLATEPLKLSDSMGCKPLLTHMEEFIMVLAGRSISLIMSTPRLSRSLFGIGDHNDLSRRY